MQWKRLHIGTYEAIMVILVVVAALLRVVLISFHWPWANSDEGFMDLMALHIAYRGEHPVFFYGQAYMGPLEAYIGALNFRLFGTSVFSLRLGLILFFSLFLVCMYCLTSLLYTKRLALITVALLSLGSSEMMMRQLMAIGGYPEIVFFAACIFLLVSKLALSSPINLAELAGKERWRRVLAFGLLGCIVGFAFWDDPLILFCLLAGMLLLCLFCWRELCRWGGLFLLLGCIVGAWPFIAYNSAAGPGYTTLDSLQRISDVTRDEVKTMHIPASRQILGTVFIALPCSTGSNLLCTTQNTPRPVASATNSSCTIHNFPQVSLLSEQNLPCTLAQGSWSLGYLSLWCIAFLLAVVALWRYWRRTSLRDRSYVERQNYIRQCARLMLLISATMTLCAYSISSTSVFASNARYLTCMIVATPALLWPLCCCLRWREQRMMSLAAVGDLLRVGVLLCIFVAYCKGTISVINSLPEAQASYTQQSQLIHNLEHVGATRFYTDYWTCSRLIFESDEHLICSSLNENLHLDPQLDRYLPYRDSVLSAPHPAYVFPIGLNAATKFIRRLHVLHISYRSYTFDGYVVYMTSKRLRL